MESGQQVVEVSEMESGQRVVEVPAALVKALKEEESVFGGGATEEQQARAIIRAAKRALEEEKASDGTNPSPVVTSLRRFLAQRWAAAERDGKPTSS
jgi:hypothetical protein